MNILKFEYRQQFFSWLLWIIGLVAFGYIFFALYPTFTKDLATLKELFAAYPPEILAAIGMDLSSFTSIYGFYGVIYFYFQMLLSIYALYIGLSVASREQRAKTNDFMLSKPIKRTALFLWKAAVVITLVVLINGIIAVAFYFMSSSYNGAPLDLSLFGLIHLAMLIVTLTFSCLGILFGYWFKKIRSCATLAVGIAGFFFVLSFIQELTKHDKIKYISLMRLFNVNSIVADKQLPLLNVGICLGISFISLGIAMLYFAKRDIPQV